MRIQIVLGELGLCQYDNTFTYKDLDGLLELPEGLAALIPIMIVAGYSPMILFI
jgi:hypothetical protein